MAKPSNLRHTSIEGSTFERRIQAFDVLKPGLAVEHVRSSWCEIT
jgi:hypothetical protein